MFKTAHAITSPMNIKATPYPVRIFLFSVIYNRILRTYPQTLDWSRLAPVKELEAGARIALLRP